MPKQKKKHRRAAERHYTDNEIILNFVYCFMKMNDIQALSVYNLPDGYDITFEPDKNYSNVEGFETLSEGLILYMDIHNLKHMKCSVRGNRIELHGKPFTAAQIPYNIMTVAAIKKHSAGVETVAECL